MQQDAVIWEVIRHNHCSFMAKLETGNFCRNPYNVTGICNRSSCPLANSRYATIREHEGVFYLYMKTIERAHTPNKLWERVKLPQNYMKALEVIDKHLMYWPKLLVHKIKQRLTKMTQMRIRMRKLALKTREKIMTTPRKDTKRESRREEKAEKAACIERKIEQELIARIKQGVYGEIYNYPESKFHQILDGLDKVELNSEYEKEEEEEEEQEVEYVEGFDELEEELEEDMEDFGLYSINEPLKNQGLLSDDDGDIEMVDNKKLKRKSASGRDKSEKYESGKLKKLTKVLVEVEDEDTSARQTALAHR